MDWIEQYFSYFYFGDPFQPFGPPHLAALAIIATITGLVIFFRKRIKPPAQRSIRIALILILLISQGLWSLWVIKAGGSMVQNLIPLHLCSLLSLVSAVMLLTHSQALFDIIYAPGICGAVFALLSPNLGLYGYPHFLFFQTMVVHAALLISQVYMAALEGYHPRPKSFSRVLIAVNLYLLIVTTVNWLAGTNYFFTMHKPDEATLLDYLGPWPWYILGVEAISIPIMALLYLPFADLAKTKHIQ